MTLPSGRSSLKKTLLETYTALSNIQIEKLAESKDNAIDYSVTAISEYETILLKDKEENRTESMRVDDKLVSQFQCLNEEVQLTLNIVFFSFLKKHRNKREMFKEVCPTVYDLFDKIVNHPIKQDEITPSYAFIYENFLFDLKVSLLSDDGSIELVDKIGEAIEILRGNNSKEDEANQSIFLADTNREDVPAEIASFSFDDLKVEQVYSDELPKVSNATLEMKSVQDNTFESRSGKAWTVDEENLIRLYYLQGKNFLTIASLIGRTEVAIKSRLAKLGLIGQEDGFKSQASKDTRNLTENDFVIENSSNRAYIFDKEGKRVFVTDGKMKFLRNKLYRLNLKRECFTLKSMLFNGTEWIKGTKKIVAYPQSELYIKIKTAVDYNEEVEDIIDSPYFEECKLKFKDVWYTYNGNSITDSTKRNIVTDNREQLNREISEIKNSPLYAVRRQAILRAMEYFRVPANIRDITRTISRTAWRSVIKEKEVEEIIKTISEVKCVDGKYFLY